MPNLYNPAASSTIINRGGTYSLIAAQDLEEGQVVYLSADNTVSAVTSGAQYPIGTVNAPAAINTKVDVLLNERCVTYGIAKGGALTYGQFVRHDGTISTDGAKLPKFVVAASGEYAHAIVLDGGAVDTRVRVAVLSSPKIV